MARFESIEAWKKFEVVQLDNIEYGLYIVRNELDLGTEPVASLVIGGNRAIDDFVYSDFVHHLGRIAYSTGLLDGIRERAYGQEEIITDIARLVGLGTLVEDVANPARYAFPGFQHKIAR